MQNKHLPAEYHGCLSFQHQTNTLKLKQVPLLPGYHAKATTQERFFISKFAVFKCKEELILKNFEKKHGVIKAL